MTRVLLFATTTGYQIRSFGEAAEALGIQLVFASDRCDHLEDPWRDEAIAVRFHDSEASLEAVVRACQRQPPAGVLAVGDRPTVLAAHVAAALGLLGNPPASAEASRNKLASRRAFVAAGLLTPHFHTISAAQGLSDLPALEYPVVIKPLSLSGSRGVIRADDVVELESALERVRRLLKAPDVALERNAVHERLLVESFIPGLEYAVEGVLTDGTLQAVAIFDKPDPLDGPFFEETLYVTPSRAPTGAQTAILDAVAAAASALGLRHGPVHAECRVNERGVYVLEVAARPIGGLCSKALRLEGPGGNQATLEEMLLRHASGEDVGGYRLAPGASGVMMIPIPRRGVYRGVSGVDEARQVPGIEDVRITAKPDARLVPLPEGRSYLGFIFARGDQASAVEQALRDAHTRLRFEIERELVVVDGVRS